MANPDEHDPETTTGTSGDTTSDPGLDSGDSTDWSSEGGAAPEGPATDADNGDEGGDEDDATTPGSLGGDNGGA